MYTTGGFVAVARQSGLPAPSSRFRYKPFAADRAPLIIVPSAFRVESVDPEHEADASIVARHAHACRVLRQLVGSFGCQPIAYQTENDGRPWRVVRPTLKDAQKPSSHGLVAFDPHSDNTNRACQGEPSDGRAPPPDVLALGCLVNEGEVATSFISAWALLRKLSRHDRCALAQPHFLFRAPASDNGPVHQGRVWMRDGLRLDVNTDSGVPRTEGLTRAAQRALKALREAIEVTEPYHVVLRPGDACAWMNHAYLHLRGPIRGRRCLLRLYGLRRVCARWRVAGHVLR